MSDDFFNVYEGVEIYDDDNGDLIEIDHVMFAQFSTKENAIDFLKDFCPDGFEHYYSIRHYIRNHSLDCDEFVEEWNYEYLLDA